MLGGGEDPAGGGTASGVTDTDVMPKRTRAGEGGARSDGASAVQRLGEAVGPGLGMMASMAASTAASEASKSSTQISESRSTPSTSRVRSFEPMWTRRRCPLGRSRRCGTRPTAISAMTQWCRPRWRPSGLRSTSSRHASSSQSAHEREHEVVVRRLLPGRERGRSSSHGEHVGPADIAVATPVADHRLLSPGSHSAPPRARGTRSSESMARYTTGRGRRRVTRASEAAGAGRRSRPGGRRPAASAHAAQRIGDQGEPPEQPHAVHGQGAASPGSGRQRPGGSRRGGWRGPSAASAATGGARGRGRRRGPCHAPGAHVADPDPPVAPSRVTACRRGAPSSWAGADHGGDPQPRLTMAAWHVSAAAVGDQAGGPADRRHPVGLVMGARTRRRRGGAALVHRACRT